MAALRAAETIGRPLGSPAFLDTLAATTGRDARPKRRYGDTLLKHPVGQPMPRGIKDPQTELLRRSLAQKTGRIPVVVARPCDAGDDAGRAAILRELATIRRR